MRIERKYVAHYINVNVPEQPEFVRLGKDLEEFTPEMSAKVERLQNILGESRVLVSGYEKTAAVEGYYAERGTVLFEMLQSIIDKDLVMDDVKTQILEVKLWESAPEDLYPAILEDAYIEITSFGGDSKGYRIGFNLHYTGIKTQGMFDPKTGTFTENEA